MSSPAPPLTVPTPLVPQSAGGASVATPAPARSTSQREGGGNLGTFGVRYARRHVFFRVTDCE